MKLISNFVTSQPGLQTNAIYILTNISRIKSNKAMNEIWSVNRVFLETFLLKNHTQNILEKLSPDPFLKNQN